MALYIGYELIWVVFLQVFIGKIPKDTFEDEIIPLVEECGPVWDLRLMMDPMTGFSRGYAFCTFVDRESAKVAVQKVCIVESYHVCLWC